jgi:hypothetical protein
MEGEGVFNSNYSQMPILVKILEQLPTLYMKTYANLWSCQVVFVRKLLNNMCKNVLNKSGTWKYDTYCPNILFCYFVFVWVSKEMRENAVEL